MEEITRGQRKRKSNIISELGENDKDHVDYDQLLVAAGELGTFQVFMCLASSVFYISGGIVYFSQVFITEVAPNHWCWIPELGNFTDIQRRNLAIPADPSSTFGYSQCTSYDVNWTEVLVADIKPNSSWSSVPCKNGWEFNKTEFPYPTISSELGWVCEKDSYQASAQSVFFVGSIFGGLLVGWVADRFGRLPALMLSNLIAAAAGVLSIFAIDFISFAVCRFMMGMAYDHCMMMGYLLVLEQFSPKYRSKFVNLSFAFFFCLILTTLPWISLACAHWKTISLATSLPLLIYILAPLVFSESPRWLLSKGRTEDAISKALRIAKYNKKEIPSKLIEHFRTSAAKQKPEERESVIELLERPLLRRMFICLCLLYMLDMMVFDGLVRTIGGLNFDFFVSFTVSSFTELPSLALIAFILDLTGRKLLVVVALSISCVFSILTIVVGGGLPSVLCAVVARFAVNMASNACMQWMVEALPASVRGSASSMIHIFGYIGTVMSPFIAYLKVLIVWLPMVVIGVIAGCGAIISLGIPETANREMPQTFDDAENLIRGQGIIELPCKRRVNSTMNGQVNNE